VVNGLPSTTDSPDTSSSDGVETTSALHAQLPILEVDQHQDHQAELTSASTPSKHGDNQDGGLSSQLLNQTITVDIILNPTTVLEISTNATTGSRRMPAMPNISSSDLKETITAHHANGKVDTDTLEPPVDTTLLDTTQLFTSSRSKVGLSQSNHGKKITKEEPEVDTVPDTDNLLSTTELH
jgi:hypothetical protein